MTKATKFTVYTYLQKKSKTEYYPHAIKWGRAIVGEINNESPFIIRLVVREDYAVFRKDTSRINRIVTIKKRFESLQDAKEFLNEKFKYLTKKYRFTTY
jgi:hypothetical protein